METFYLMITFQRTNSSPWKWIFYLQIKAESCSLSHFCKIRSLNERSSSWLKIQKKALWALFSINPWAIRFMNSSANFQSLIVPYILVDPSKAIPSFSSIQFRIWLTVLLKLVTAFITAATMKNFETWSLWEWFNQIRWDSLPATRVGILVSLILKWRKIPGWYLSALKHYSTCAPNHFGANY